MRRNQPETFAAARAWRQMTKRVSYALAFLPLLVVAGLANAQDPGSGRADFQRVETVYAGHWGPWSAWQFCAGEGNHVIGLRARSESQQSGGGDDTALNAIEFICADGQRLRPHEGHWGSWSGDLLCNAARSELMTDIILSTVKPAGNADDVGSHLIRYQCANVYNEITEGVAGLGQPCRGNWDSLFNSCNIDGPYSDSDKARRHVSGTMEGNWTLNNNWAALCGLRVRVENQKGNGDDTALNGLEVAFCKYDGAPFYLKSAGADLYLHASGGANSGAQTTLHSCLKASNSPQCQWIFEPSATFGSAWYIKVKGTDLYLHALGGSSPGAQVTLHPCPKANNHLNCQWILQSSPTKSGYFYIQSVHNLGAQPQHIHSPGGMVTNIPLTLHLCPYGNDYPNCQWKFEYGYPANPLSLGSHSAPFQKWNASLRNERSGRCLDVASNTNGGGVVIADCGDANARPFQVWALEGGGRVRNQQSNRCLDVASNTNGGGVVIADCGDANARPFQVWAKTNTHLFNQQSGKCLDVASNTNGGGVVIFDCGQVDP